MQESSSLSSSSLSSVTHDPLMVGESTPISSSLLSPETTSNSPNDHVTSSLRRSAERNASVMDTRYTIKADVEHRKEREWAGNSQGATNSDSSDYEPTVTFDNDNSYPVDYNCDGIVQEDWMTSKELVWFDYEVAIANNADVNENIKAIQWSILDNVVQVIGLDRCEVDKQKRYIDRLRRDLLEQNDLHPRRQLQTDAADASTIQGSEEQQNPSVNLSYPTTIYEVSTSDNDEIGNLGDCNFLHYDEDSVCIPIRGTLWTYFRGDDVAEVQAYVRRIVRNSMEAKKTVVKDITGVEYVGDRFSAVKSQGAPTNVEPKSSSHLFVDHFVGTLVALASLVVALLLAFLICRARKRQQIAKDDRTADLETGSPTSFDTTGKPDAEQEPENGTMLSAPVATFTLSSSSDESEPEKAQTVQDQTVQVQDHPNQMQAQPNKVQAEQDQTGQEQPEQAQAPDVHSAETQPKQSDQACQGSNALDSNAQAALPPLLPPRPPVRTLSSQGSRKLKKRRKKKKKKKKAMALKRINSRENVKEMDTIPESEGESEFGSECDSEFETDDEEGSSTYSSSGCLTPARSRSVCHSRSSSPQLSPQDELFPANVFENFDFVIETNDFPFPNLHTVENSQSQPPKQDTTETKIRNPTDQHFVHLETAEKSHSRSPKPPTSATTIRHPVDVHLPSLQTAENAQPELLKPITTATTPQHIADFPFPDLQKTEMPLSKPPKPPTTATTTRNPPSDKTKTLILI